MSEIAPPGTPGRAAGPVTGNDRSNGSAADLLVDPRDGWTPRQRTAVERIRQGYRAAGVAGLAGLLCSATAFVANGASLDANDTGLWGVLAVISVLAVVGRFLVQGRSIAFEHQAPWRLMFGFFALLAALLWGVALAEFSLQFPADSARVGLTAAAIAAAMLVSALFYQPWLLVLGVFGLTVAAWAWQWRQGVPPTSLEFLFIGVFGSLLLLTGLIAALMGRRAVADAVGREVQAEGIERLRAQLEAKSEYAREATAQKAGLQQDLRSARDEAEQATRAKTEFLAMMSHEIRTPLNGIVPILELLRDGRLDTEQAKLLSVADQSSRQLLRIINDILDFAKAEAGKLELEDIELSVRDIAGSVAELMANNAARKGLSLSLSVDEALPFYLRGDPIRLRQILTNLVSNAIKFTDEGGIKVQVDLNKLGRKELEVRFAVTDTGIGMSPQTAARLFTSFTQADASTTRKHGGTGLGLAISKHLVDLMGGEIGVDSEPSKGSTFWFVLPMRRSVTDVPIRRKTLDEARVLLLASQADARRRYREMLGSWGMLVEHAVDLTEAMTKLKSSAMLGRSWVYELLLIDAENFEVDLAAFCNELRDLGDLHDMSVAILTGSARLEQELRADNNGHHVLRAPVKREQLRRHLYRLLDVEGSGASAERLHSEPPRPVLDPLLNRDSELVIQPEVKTGFSGKVLLVEDNPVNSSVAKRLLARLGLSCVVAEHGGEALDCLEREVFDLIFMDVQMPVMDGYAATRNIRHREAELAGRRIPIIAMTANAMAGDREKCLAAGMDDYIAKPVSAAKLRELIQVWLPQPSVALAKAAEGVEPVSFDALDRVLAASAGPDSSGAAKPAAVTSSSVRASGDLIDAEVVAELIEVMGDDFSGLVQTYLNNTPNYLEQIRTAISAGDVKATVLPVHSLKSSSANVGAMQLYDFAKQLEALARTDSLAEVEAGYGPLVEHFERAASELRRMIGAELPA